MNGKQRADELLADAKQYAVNLVEQAQDTVPSDATFSDQIYPERDADTGRSTSPPLLDEAKGLIYGDRAVAYGDYNVEAKRLADLWTAYLGVTITPEQVPAMMVLLKVCRLSNSPTHYDSWVDIAGYAGCAAKIDSIKDARQGEGK